MVNYHQSPSEVTSVITLSYLYGLLRSYSFLLIPPNKILWFLSTSRQKEITHFPEQHFFKVCFSPAERGEDFGTEKNDQN